MLKVGVIGPTNIEHFSYLMEESKNTLENLVWSVGEILAKNDCELWINSDGGMLNLIRRAYKNYTNKKCIILYPEKGEPWSNNHATSFINCNDKGIEIKKEKNWFWSNYNVVSLVDIVVCVGISAGTLSELAYIKWNYQFNCGNLKKLIGIKDLLREDRFPLEIEIEIKNIITYIDTAEDLENFIIAFKNSESTFKSTIKTAKVYIT